MCAYRKLSKDAELLGAFVFVSNICLFGNWKNGQDPRRRMSSVTILNIHVTRAIIILTPIFTNADYFMPTNAGSCATNAGITHNRRRRRRRWHVANSAAAGCSCSLLVGFTSNIECGAPEGWGGQVRWWLFISFGYGTSLSGYK